MTNTSLAVLTGGVGLLAAWMSSAAGTVPAAAEPRNQNQTSVGSAAAQAAAPTPALLDVEREVARLSARLEAAPRPRRPVRNPFTLTPRPRATSPPPPVAAAAPRPAPAVTDGVAAGPPAVSLVGIGVERTSYGRRRTAILSADGRVFLAHIGDEAFGRFQVRAVTDDAVELFDFSDGGTLRLTLP